MAKTHNISEKRLWSLTLKFGSCKYSSTLATEDEAGKFSLWGYKRTLLISVHDEIQAFIPQ